MKTENHYTIIITKSGHYCHTKTTLVHVHVTMVI